MRLRTCLLVLLLGCISGCAAPTAQPVIPSATVVFAADRPSLTPTAAVVLASLTVSPTPPARTATPTPQPITLCSPLQDIPLSEFNSPELLKNPFLLPRPGQDDGHHGADFAYWSRADRHEMTGHPIQSALSGVVAGVLPNRPPYGNAILIETRLDALPTQWSAALPAYPTGIPTAQPIPNLYCPDLSASSALKQASAVDHSLYLLYAHMQAPSPLQTGQAVSCGEIIGAVGTTGKSVNAHLHLETRLGPARARFESMAHYETSASDAEMAAYCLWRASGIFAMFDPMQVLTLQP